MVALNGEVAELGTKYTGIGTAIGDVEVERIADAVGDLAGQVDFADAEEIEGVV